MQGLSRIVPESSAAFGGIRGHKNQQHSGAVKGHHEPAAAFGSRTASEMNLKWVVFGVRTRKAAKLAVYAARQRQTKKAQPMYLQVSGDQSQARGGTRVVIKGTENGRRWYMTGGE